MKTEPCCECGEPVEHCAIPNSEDTFSEFACYECGKALCDSCDGDVMQVVIGDPNDGDLVSVCTGCWNKAMMKGPMG